MIEAYPLRPTGNLRDIILQGALMAWQDGGPVLLSITSTDDVYLPLFSSERWLRWVLMVKLGIPYDKIKRVCDTDVFFASIPEQFDGRKVHVIYDPSISKKGRILYHEVQRPATGESLDLEQPTRTDPT